MNPFPIGERVELISCPDFPGTVTGFVRGKAFVRFDDFANEDPKPFRPDSLQLVGKRARLNSVPETVAFGTGILGPTSFVESNSCRGENMELFGTDAEHNSQLNLGGTNSERD